MLTLYYLNDAITNGYKDSILDILSSICILSGVFTITSKNPIVSIIFLISLFCVISIYLIMVDISFIGISYLLVYVGAVSILFLFILMLINIRISELLNKSNNYIPLAILSIITFIYIIGQDIPNKLEINNLNIENNEKNEYFFNSEELKLVTSNNWERSLIDVTDISSIGNIMYTSYSILLILISLILLLSMVGSIIICIRNNRTTK